MAQACFKERIDGSSDMRSEISKGNVCKRKRRRPKKRYLYVIESEMKCVSVEDVGDRVQLKLRTRVADPK